MSVSHSDVPIAMRLYSALLHAFPIVKSGVTRLSFNAITNRMFARCSDPIVAKLLDGTPIEVAPNDYHGRVLYLFGTNDPKVQATAQGLLRRRRRLSRHRRQLLDDRIVCSRAGGAQRAGFTCLSRRSGYVGASHMSIAHRRLANVVLHRVALMDHDGEMRLSRPRHHSGMATLVDYGGTGATGRPRRYPFGILHRTSRLWWRGRQFGVKLDVEGAEPFLMPWLLSQPGLQVSDLRGSPQSGRTF